MRLGIYISAIAATILMIISTSQTSIAQQGLKIQTTRTGDLFVYGGVGGQLTFSNDDSIGDPNVYFGGYFLARLDSAGSVKWLRHIKTENQFGFGKIGLCTDSLDNLYISGNYTDTIRFDSTNFRVNSYFQDHFIAKYDSSGQFIWAQSIIGNWAQLVDIDIDSDANVYAAGTFNEGGIAINTLTSTFPLSNQGYDLFIIKLDSAGNGIWTRQLHGTALDSTVGRDVKDIAVDNSGNIYLTGYYGLNDNEQLHFGDYFVYGGGNQSKIFLAKCDSSGNPVWLQRVSGSPGDDVSEQIATLDQNNIYLTGLFEGYAQFGDLTPLSATSRDAFLARYDSVGNAQWVRQYAPNISSCYNESKGLSIDTSGNLFTIGRINDSISIPPFQPLPILSGHGYFVKHDPNGNALCVANRHLRLEDITTSIDGHVYTISGDPEEIGYYGPTHIIISKWDGNCNHLWDTSIEYYLYIGLEEVSQNSLVNVFPNPTSNILNIDISDKIGRSVVEIYNSSGMLVQSRNFDQVNQTVELDLSTKLEGIYILKIVSDKGIIMKRIVKI